MWEVCSAGIRRTAAADLGPGPPRPAVRTGASSFIPDVLIVFAFPTENRSSFEWQRLLAEAFVFPGYTIGSME